MKRHPQRAASMVWLAVVVLTAACAGSVGPADGGTGGGTAAGNGGGAAAGNGGGAAGSGGGTAGGRAGGSAGDGGALIPNPLISRGKPIVGSDSQVSVLTDGFYLDEGPGFWHRDAPFFAAIKVGPGPTRILISWDTNTPQWNYTAFGAPRDYEILVSADNVTYTSALKVTDNPWARRAHSVDFTGMAWVKLNVTRTHAANGVTGNLGEVDVFDVSNGAQDTWVFFGGGNYRFAFNKSVRRAPSFATLINQAHPTYFPAMLSAGVSGRWLAADAITGIDAWLDATPDFLHVVLNYGTNDAQMGYATPIATFKSNLQTLIDKVKAKGRIPVLANLNAMNSAMYPNNAPYNQAIAELNQANGLRPGPDLVPWFMAHLEQLCQQGQCENDPAALNAQPNDLGMASLNRLWADAMMGLYAP